MMVRIRSPGRTIQLECTFTVQPSPVSVRPSVRNDPSRVRRPIRGNQHSVRCLKAPPLTRNAINKSRNILFRYRGGHSAHDIERATAGERKE
jgi:hypothetical protein